MTLILILKVAQRITRLVEKQNEEEADLSRLDETAASMQEALAKAMSAPPPADQLS